MSFLSLTIMTVCHIITKNYYGDIMDTKKIVIAGCRDYNNYEETESYIDFCIKNIKKEYNLVFVSGGCSGADKLGERYAAEHGYKIEVYPAEWKKYGPQAGPIRNMEMAKISDFVICFWDGESNGTRSMINCAKKLNKPIKIKLITKNT